MNGYDLINNSTHPESSNECMYSRWSERDTEVYAVYWYKTARAVGVKLAILPATELEVSPQKELKYSYSDNADDIVYTYGYVESPESKKVAKTQVLTEKDEITFKIPVRDPEYPEYADAITKIGRGHLIKAVSDDTVTTTKYAVYVVDSMELNDIKDNRADLCWICKASPYRGDHAVPSNAELSNGYVKPTKLLKEY